MQEAILNDEPIPESKNAIREPNKYFQDKIGGRVIRREFLKRVIAVLGKR